MNQKLIVLALALCLACTACAQNARVQFIHNSADTSVSVIDVYLNEDRIIDNLPFHYASAFMTLPADVEGSLSIADSSSAVYTDAVSVFDFSPVSAHSYVIVLDGNAAAGYDPQSPLALNIFDGARETGSDLTSTDLLFHNGSTDAGVTDIVETELLLLPAVEDISYGEFRNYLTLPTADFEFTLMDENELFTHGSFFAPLSFMALGGKAVTIVISGYTHPEINHHGELESMWLARAEGGAMTELASEEFALQLIHNSADNALETVDVYLGDQKLADDLGFRNASSMLRRRTASPSSISVAHANSISPDDAFYSIELNVAGGDSLMLMLEGISSTNGYDPAIPFIINAITADAPPQVESGEVGVVFHNGVTDAGLTNLVDVTNSNVLLDDFGFGYTSTNDLLPANNYQWDAMNSSEGYDLASFGASFQDMALGGKYLLILQNGFLHPLQNSNGAAFGLWVVTSEGGAMLELPRAAEEQTDVFFINNSADDALSTIDIYQNDELVLNDLSFGSEAGNISLKAASDIEIRVADGNSAGPFEAFATFHYNLVAGEKHYMIANGIRSEDGYNPAPAFDVALYNNARQTSVLPGDVDMLFYNGSTDSGNMDVKVSGGSNVFADVQYDHFQGYSSLDAGDNYALEFTNTGGSFSFGEYEFAANQLDLAGDAVLLLSGGFLNPANNNDGPGQQMWLVEWDGTFTQLQPYVSVGEYSEQTLALYPNPSSDVIFIKGLNSNQSFMVCDVFGRMVMTGSARSDLDISGLSPGSYSLLVVNDESVISRRFQVAR